MSKSIATAPQSVQKLFQMAVYAREKAYAPYSHCKVGSVVETTTGEFYTGCNVENASYGGSICAERTAIVKAVSEQGSQSKIKSVMVVTDATPPWPPCGMCRQVIAEFGSEITIYLANLKGDFEEMSFQQIFPQAFTPSYLPTP